MTFEHEMNCAQAFRDLSRKVVSDKWEQYQHRIEQAIRHAPTEDQTKLHNGLNAIMVAQESAYCVLSQDRPMVRTIVQWIDDEHVMEASEDCDNNRITDLVESNPHATASDHQPGPHQGVENAEHNREGVRRKSNGPTPKRKWSHSPA